MNITRSIIVFGCTFVCLAMAFVYGFIQYRNNHCNPCATSFDYSDCRIAEKYYFFYIIEGSGDYLELYIFKDEDLAEVLNLFEKRGEYSYIQLFTMNMVSTMISKEAGMLFVADYDFDGNREIVVTNIESMDVVEVSPLDIIIGDKNPLLRINFILITFIVPLILPFLLFWSFIEGMILIKRKYQLSIDQTRSNSKSFTKSS